MEKTNRKRHITKKVSVFLLEACGLSVAAALIFVGAFLWHLSSGPINVSFANPYIEQALSGISPSFDVTVADTELAWDGYNTPIRIVAQNVQILNASGGQITAISEVGVDLSLRHLVVGDLVPTRISLFSPELVVKHLENGAFDVNLQNALSDDTDDPNSPDNKEESESFIKHLLDEMQEPPGGENATSLLREVAINGARIFYDDQKNGFSLTASNADLMITRDQDGLLGVATITLDIEGREETLRGEFGYDRALGVYQIGAVFIDILPTNLIAIAPDKLDFLKQIRMPLSLHSYIGLDQYFQPLYIDVKLASKEGILALPDLYDEPLSVHKAEADIRYDARLGTLAIEMLDIDFYDMKLGARGKAGFTEAMSIYFKGNATLSELAADNLSRFWPKGLASNARDWVTTRLSEGQVHQADIQLGMTIPQGNLAALSLDTLEGTMDVSGVTVDYLPPMPPVKGVDANIAFDAQTFNITAESGHIGDIAIDKGHIVIEKLDTHLPDMVIDLNASAPLGDVLALINNEPLGYADQMGFAPSDFSGKAKVRVHLAFPLLSDLPMEKVTVETSALLSDVTARRIVMQKDLTAERLDILVNNKQLRLEGDGYLAGIPGSFIWQEFFENDAPLMRRIDAQVATPVDRLDNLDIPVTDYASGFAEASVLLTATEEDKNRLSIDANLTQAQVRLDEIIYNKPIGVEASASFEIPIVDGAVAHIENIVYDAPQTSLRGTASLNPDGSIKELFFPNFSTPLMTTTLSMKEHEDGRNGFAIDLKGAYLDASAFVEQDEPDAQPEMAEPIVENETGDTVIGLNIDSMILSHKKPDTPAWKNVKGLVHSRNGKITRMEFDASVGSGDVYLRYTPKEVASGHDLRVESRDAGAFLYSTGLTSSIRGGLLAIGGQTDPQNPKAHIGAIDIRNFTVVDAPVLARLLNAFSLPGLLELLGNQGITFTRLKSSFSYTDDVLAFREGAAYGSSVGFDYEGNVNTGTRAMQIEGTIIPAYQLNRMVGRIPLVGQILGGVGSEGVIAAKFEVRGKGQEANVSVNPLSALTPGILRSIFFDKELDEIPNEITPLPNEHPRRQK